VGTLRKYQFSVARLSVRKKKKFLAAANLEASAPNESGQRSQYLLNAEKLNLTASR